MGTKDKTRATRCPSQLIIRSHTHRSQPCTIVRPACMPISGCAGGSASISGISICSDPAQAPRPSPLISYMNVCVHACMHACMHACVRACGRECDFRACGRARTCTCVHVTSACHRFTYVCMHVSVRSVGACACRRASRHAREHARLIVRGHTRTMLYAHGVLLGVNWLCLRQCCLTYFWDWSDCVSL